MEELLSHGYAVRAKVRDAATAELIRPAVDGTLRVLRAAARSGLRRVVMTSSTDAIVPGHLAPYPKSKMQAERVAWDFAATHQWNWFTINPGLVLGPLQREQRSTSMEVVRLLLARKLPAVPRLSFAVVDVRDIV
jgi:dihydroflavonol-4-reductase